MDVHFSAYNFHTLKNVSVTKFRTYREAWQRFLASDDPGDLELKPLYRSVAKHHPEQAILAGAPEVIPFGVNFAGKLTDSASAFLYRLASIKYPKQQKNWSYKAFRSRWMMHYVRLIQLAVTDSASHAITLGCCHLKSHIDSDVIDDFPSIPYPVDRASQVLPAFQDGRPVHSLRVAHRSIRVPGSVGNYLEQLAQNARTASLAPHVVPEPPSDDGSDWSFLTPSVQGNSQPSHSVSDLNSVIFHSLRIGKTILYCNQLKVRLNQTFFQLLIFRTSILIIYSMTMMIYWNHLNHLSMIGNLLVIVLLESVFLYFIQTVWWVSVQFRSICLQMVMMWLYFIFFTMMVIKKIWIVMNVLLLWNSIVKTSQLWIQLRPLRDILNLRL